MGKWLLVMVTLLGVVNGIDIFLEWNVSIAYNIIPLSPQQPVITINGMFPGPLVNTTTNDIVHVNVFNNLDEPLLFTWNGIQQRLNSWQDGVTGTNCPIKPATNWTYVFQTKDQIGSFFYFPSLNFQKAAGGYGPIRVNNRNVISVPFPKPEDEFDLLIGDWQFDNYKDTRRRMGTPSVVNKTAPDAILMNGKVAIDYQSLLYLNVTKGKTYRLRVSNVGSAYSLNFRIDKHKMVLVETEGSYTNQIELESIDVHVGQSFSLLVTMDQNEDSDYYIVASPLLFENPSPSPLAGVGALHYFNSISPVEGPLPSGPDPFNMTSSINQANSIRWNMTTGAARPNPQGTFNVSNVNISQTFILESSRVQIGNESRYSVNNVSYLTINTPLKLADYFVNGSNVYQLDSFPVDTVNSEASYGISVVTGIHKGWIELVFLNNFEVIDSWHLDGFGFYVVGYGIGRWGEEGRESYNKKDPVVRSTVQVYPKGWTAVYAYLDNPGMWNLRSQLLKNWYLGQELYIRVHDSDPNPAKELPPPPNLLLCGIFEDDGNATTPASAPW